MAAADDMLARLVATQGRAASSLGADEGLMVARRAAWLGR